MAQPSRDPSLPPRLLFRMCFAFTSRAWSTRAPLEREQRRFSAFTLSPAALSATPGPPACPATEADGARRPRAQPSQSSGRAPKKKRREATSPTARPHLRAGSGAAPEPLTAGVPHTPGVNAHLHRRSRSTAILTRSTAPRRAGAVPGSFGSCRLEEPPRGSNKTQPLSFLE